MAKKLMITTTIVLASVILLGLSSKTLPKKLEPLAPDTIYHNGTVLTMDRDESSAEAIAVKDGKVIAVGTDKEMNQLQGRHTAMKDLKGKTILPGFYDTHSHFPASGFHDIVFADLNSPPVGEITSIATLIDVMKDWGKDAAKGEWLQGQGYDQTLLKEGRHPIREDLDKISTTHPIHIMHSSGHLAVANSKALELAGITKETANPKGGTIVRDQKTGEPNGILEENATHLVSSIIPPITQKQNESATIHAVEQYASAGVTTSIIAGVDKNAMRNLQNLIERNVIPIRITAMGAGWGGMISPGEEGGFTTGFGSDRFKLGAVKISYDGSIQGYTGYLTEPYHKAPANDPDYKGYPGMDKEVLIERVKALHQAGYQIAIHGNGDAAIDDIIEAYRIAQEEFPRSDARHRIEHAQMAREDQLDSMKELGITPSYFVSHTYYWGDQHRDTFMGPERASRMSPLQSTIDRDIKFSIHLDTFVVPMSPLQAIWSAVNRTSRSGKIIGPEQRITPMQALKSVTSDAAWQNFEEKEKGSIEVGKLADFVILDKNPLTVNPEKIKDISVHETIVADQTVFPSSTGKGK